MAFARILRIHSMKLETLTLVSTTIAVARDDSDTRASQEPKMESHLRRHEYSVAE